ncbi:MULTISPECIES: NAD(P)/FAD-dependent oxidoreductase [unclassified Haladaptatus]|uniref:NAD(P)/FAD-dependent oxidoreductase n=1 Tax=unclassified Haladaptatus TaxID=2622732 RepID=UPI0023E7DDF1|nr:MULTISPECIES: NAD(P)/FAD-dependent oxidoreductase [unclassified Haladaptatus]
MTENIVVIGAGYAGAAAIQSLEAEVDNADITWISKEDYHLVLHEVHRCIRDPSVRDKISLPVADIKSPRTRFIKAEVESVDTDDREITLDDDSTVEYDYLVVALGSKTAYYGIPGLEENSLTLKGLDDALEIHNQVKEAAREASRNDPAKIVIGGAGLSGIQTAGEIAEFRDMHRAPIEIYLVEAMEEIFPGQDPEVQGALRKRLLDADINILTNDPITEAAEDTIYFDEGEPLEFDVFVWTGGITGQDALEVANVEKNHNRVNADATFQTSDERVFALGDSAIVEQLNSERPAPPTAQAAWQAGGVVGENVARAMRGQALNSWSYKDKGTVVSVGDDAVAHNVMMVPIGTFGGPAARVLKKSIATRWIADITSVGRAMSAWGDM